MRRVALRLSGATAPAIAGHGVINKPTWWNHPIPVPPSEAELALFQPAAEATPSTRYKKHPWFRNFGQNRLCVVDAPPRGEFFRAFAFWKLMKEKSKELGIKGSLLWLVLMLRRQREAWYLKGFDSELVGIDEMGNKYWQSAYTTAVQSRWVEYPERSCFNTDSTIVSPDWYSWLYHSPTPNPQEIRQRHPDCYGKGMTSDYWYRMRWTELTYDDKRRHYPRGHAHPDNEKFDDFVLRNRRVSRRKGFMEFDPFVLPAERLRKRQKWTSNPIGDRHHAYASKNLPL